MTDPKKPTIGMTFKSDDDAYAFYNAYSGHRGFSVSNMYKNVNKTTRRITSRKFVCSAVGHKGYDKCRENVEKRREDTRCECPVHMSILLNRKVELYKVSSFEESHKNEVHIPKCSHLMQSQRKFLDAQCAQAEMAHSSGISLKQCFELMGNEVGGKENLGFTKNNMKRHLQMRRQWSMEYGEAASLLDYFQWKQTDNPVFYSSYMLDSGQKITNIFWADARMIMNYSNFEDVISFDTTYKTNKAHRPFAVFAGFNHQRKTIIFGGSLMCDETVNSFEWLFRTFIDCMNGVKPTTIFTDQAQAIALALGSVMPETYHGLCTWHLSQNLAKHYGRFVKTGILRMWWTCVKDAMDEVTFEAEWKKMVDKYEVGNEDWFVKTYNLRKKWVASFMKTTTTLGMASTQLSESLNASLKDLVHVNLSITNFFKQR